MALTAPRLSSQQMAPVKLAASPEGALLSAREACQTAMLEVKAAAGVVEPASGVKDWLEDMSELLARNPANPMTGVSADPFLAKGRPYQKNFSDTADTAQMLLQSQPDGKAPRTEFTATFENWRKRNASNVLKSIATCDDPPPILPRAPSKRSSGGRAAREARELREARERYRAQAARIQFDPPATLLPQPQPAAPVSTAVSRPPPPVAPSAVPSPVPLQQLSNIEVSRPPPPAAPSAVPPPAPAQKPGNIEATLLRSQTMPTLRSPTASQVQSPLPSPVNARPSRLRTLEGKPLPLSRLEEDGQEIIQQMMAKPGAQALRNSKEFQREEKKKLEALRLEDERLRREREAADRMALRAATEDDKDDLWWDEQDRVRQVMKKLLR